MSTDNDIMGSIQSWVDAGPMDILTDRTPAGIVYRVRDPADGSFFCSTESHGFALLFCAACNECFEMGRSGRGEPQDPAENKVGSVDGVRGATRTRTTRPDGGSSPDAGGGSPSADQTHDKEGTP